MLLLTVISLSIVAALECVTGYTLFRGKTVGTETEVSGSSTIYSVKRTNKLSFCENTESLLQRTVTMEDCANGSMSTFIPEVYVRLGFVL